MSDFSVSSSQRRRLLQGDYSPLDYGKGQGVEGRDTKLPYGCKPGARYVLDWQPGRPEWVPGHGVRALRVPLRFLTVTKVGRHRKGFWRVQFDVTDLRDKDLFLKPGGGYTSSFDALSAGPVPDRDWLSREAKLSREFWAAERLRRFAVKRAERDRARRKKAA